MWTHFLFSKQCFAFTPQANFPAHDLNFHWRWRWWDQIQVTFWNSFYFNMGNICKNFKNNGWIFATHSFTNSTLNTDFEAKRHENKKTCLPPNVTKKQLNLLFVLDLWAHMSSCLFFLELDNERSRLLLWKEFWQELGITSRRLPPL